MLLLLLLLFLFCYFCCCFFFFFFFVYSIFNIFSSYLKNDIILNIFLGLSNTLSINGILKYPFIRCKVASDLGLHC